MIGTIDATSRQCVISASSDVIVQSRETEQPGMEAEIRQTSGFARGLRGVAANSADAHERLGPPAVSTVHFVSRELQHGIEQPHTRVADRELRRVHADGHAPGAAAT